MFTVVSYDVVDDKRRTRVLKLLRGYGTYSSTVSSSETWMRGYSQNCGTSCAS